MGDPAEKVEKWDIEKLIPYARNARTHSNEQVGQIAASIKEWGWTTPVLVDEDGGIIAGHGRTMAAKRLGLREVPVMVARGWSDAKKRAYVLADNKLALNAGWDDAMLALELKELGETGFDLDLTGFSLDEIAALTPVEVEPGLTDEDAVPEAPEEPTTRLGDVWILGQHRLMCGDSTSIDAVEKLMDGQKADMVFTDPPYGIGGYAGRSGKFEPIKNDELKNEDLVQLLSAIPEVKHSFIWTTWSTYHTFVQALGVPDALIVWLKPWPGMGRGYRGKHEFCMFYGECDATDLYNIWENGYEKEGVKSTWDRTAKCNLHPTQKPVALAEFAISNHQPQTVLDLFGGSGSTLIACEKTGRQCRMMELDPKYCDVIIKRWQDYTGKNAINSVCGREFKALQK
jgi:DNA modification methylase